MILQKGAGSRPGIRRPTVQTLKRTNDISVVHADESLNQGLVHILAEKSHRSVAQDSLATAGVRAAGSPGIRQTAASRPGHVDSKVRRINLMRMDPGLQKRTEDV